jgi:hypothetical protein
VNDPTWIWPALATAIFVLAAMCKAPPEQAEDFGFSHIVAALYFTIAIALSLAIWLLWALA